MVAMLKHERFHMQGLTWDEACIATDAVAVAPY